MGSVSKNYKTDNGDTWVVEGQLDVRGEGKLTKDGEPFGGEGEQGPPGDQGPKGDDGRGVESITYDDETGELVFGMTDSTEIRVELPSGD